jgi:uncharacterized membrane protein
MLMVLGWTAVLITYALARYNRLNATVYDLGIKSQVIWNTYQGRWFASSIEVEHYLGDHVQFIFLLMAPLFFLWEDVQILLILQSILLSLGAIPVFRIARRKLANQWLALAFAAAYLLYPTIGFVNRFDLHPVTFTIFFILMALDLLECDHPYWASFFVLLALSSREEVGFTIFALGLYVMFVMRRRKIGAIWAIGGLLYSITAVFYIIPHFRGGSSDSIGRYGWLGDSPGDIVRNLLTRPLPILQTLLNDPVRQQFLGKLLLPVGFLALLAPLPLAVGLPTLVYNLLSDVPSQSSIYFQYIAPMIPFIFLAAIHGAAWLQTKLTPRFSHPQRTAALIGWLALGVTIAWLLDNPFTTPIQDPPFYPVYGLEQLTDRRPFEEAKSLLPPEAEVATMMNYGAHLALRPVYHLFYDRGKLEQRPYGFPQTDYALLHLSDLRWGENPRLFHSAIETAVGQFGYEAIYFQDDVLLLQRLDTPQAATGAALQRLIELQEAGGKYAPTAQSTLDWLGQQWLRDALPTSATPANVTFANGVQLLGYELSESEFAPGTAVCATFYWTTTQPIPEDLTVFLHFAAADGFVSAQRDNPPALGFWPTPRWQPNHILADMHCFPIPPGTAPGSYHLNTGLYNPATSQRIPITSTPTPDNAHPLATLTIP